MDRIEYTAKNIDCIYNQVLTLFTIHKNTTSYIHAVRKGNQELEEPFIPTHFIYEFFIFNTLYSINWKYSLNYGSIKSLNGGELAEQEKYFAFIFENDEFVESYDSKFKRILFKIDINEIKYIKDRVRLDKDHFSKHIKNRGSLKDPDEVENFKKAVDSILAGEFINEEKIKSIITLIYRVRCNIFHGVKSIDELNRDIERKKLKFYTNILIAVNQMVFSYLDFLSNKKCGGDNNRFEDLWDNLKEL